MVFKSFKDIIGQAAQRYPGFQERLKEAQAVSRWEQAVGPIIAKHTQALSVKRGILYVEVDHPIWRSEMHYRKDQILQILNEAAEKGEAPLKDLFFMDPKSAQKSSSPKK